MTKIHANRGTLASRWLAGWSLLFLVVLTALFVAGSSGVGAASALHGLGAQDRVRPVSPAAAMVEGRLEAGDPLSSCDWC